MKAILTAAAAIGALAAGGLPALALTITGTESGTPDKTAVVQAVAGADDDAADGAADSDEPDDTGTPGWMRHDQRVPPGWAKNHQGGTPFGWQMRSWAKCVADHTAPGATGGEQATPPATCGAKPRPPHGNAGPPGHAKTHKTHGKPDKPQKSKQPEKSGPRQG